MKRYIVALDEGTTSARAAVFDRQQRKIIAVASKPIKQIYPRPGWVEQDLCRLYAAQISAMYEAVLMSGIDPCDILSVAVTNQRETAAAWDRETGEPVCNAIVWQCRRTAPLCKKLKSDGAEPLIAERTGLVADAYFSATKYRWILDNVPKARELLERGRLALGTIDSYLIFRLTAGRVFVTDHTNASRTMLMNLETLDWDGEMLKLFDIPRGALAEIRASDAHVGHTCALGGSLPIGGIAGDQQAALYGQGCLSAGTAKNTYGTGCFLLMNTGDKLIRSKSRLLTTVGVSAGGKISYALEGSVFSAGSAVKWLKDGLGLIASEKETAALAQSVSGSGGAYFVPALNGLGAPYWDMDARGALLGITAATGRAHVVRAVLESIGFMAADVARLMESDSGIGINRLSCDGGASANDFLMQFQADILGVPCFRAAERESTALGAALLSELSMGERPPEGAAPPAGREFLPEMKSSRRKELEDGWQSAVKRVLT